MCSQASNSVAGVTVATRASCTLALSDGSGDQNLACPLAIPAGVACTYLAFVPTAADITVVSISYSECVPPLSPPSPPPPPPTTSPPPPPATSPPPPPPSPVVVQCINPTTVSITFSTDAGLQPGSPLGDTTIGCSATNIIGAIHAAVHSPIVATEGTVLCFNASLTVANSAIANTSTTCLQFTNAAGFPTSTTNNPGQLLKVTSGNSNYQIISYLEFGCTFSQDGKVTTCPGHTTQTLTLTPFVVSGSVTTDLSTISWQFSGGLWNVDAIDENSGAPRNANGKPTARR